MKCKKHKKIRLTHIDGKLPNLALMKLAHWHKAKGDQIFLEYSADRGLFEPDYDVVYASCIFTFSIDKLERFKEQWPGAVIGGTGSGDCRNAEAITGEPYECYDYSIYPEYPHSIGFSSRGCRLKCSFCVVPQKEGKPKGTNTIYEIWREDKPKKIVLLDNDFFGHSEWRERIEEIKSGNFKVSINQGINIRIMNDEIAEALTTIKYYDGNFKKRRIYGAWDNLRDEKHFFKGVDILEKHGVPTHHLMIYMLIGYEKDESWDDILYRFNRLNERGIMPYPMVYNNKDKALKRFQKWAVMRYYEVVSWENFSRNFKDTAPDSFPKSHLKRT